MRRRKEHVVIQEPPVQQLNKRRSCLRRTCATGFGCLFIFVVTSVLVLQFLSSPREKEVKDLPTTVATIVPIYESDAVEHIRFVPGSEKSKGLRTVAYIPKLVVAPIAAALDANTTLTSSPTSYWSRMKTFIDTPITDTRDTYIIQWKELAADEEFVFDFYRRNFVSKGFTLKGLKNTFREKSFTFTKGSIVGSISVRDAQTGGGTDEVVLSISLDVE